MKKKIKQHDVTDCGAACLASIAAHYKLGLPIARIRQLASTDQRGTNLLGMIQAAEKLGFSCRGVRVKEVRWSSQVGYNNFVNFHHYGSNEIHQNG